MSNFILQPAYVETKNDFEPASANSKLTELLDNAIKNPLLSAAATLLTLLTQLPHINGISDLATFQKTLYKEIQTFKCKAADFNVDSFIIMQARYVLCASIDEMILKNYHREASTENTSNQLSIWSQQSLVSTFYHDTWGGENVYKILEQARSDPHANIDLLELILWCLNLGFEGKYRAMINGREKLKELKENLCRTLLKERDYINASSFSTSYAPPTAKRPNKKIILSSITILALVLLFTNFIHVNYKIARINQAVYQSLQNLNSIFADNPIAISSFAT